MHCSTLFHSTTTRVFLIAVYAATLGACGKAADSASLSANEPTVLGNTIRFPAHSTAEQHLLTTPVVVAQQSVLKLPARIVWDEDHTSRVVSPVAGRLTRIEVQAGAFVKADQPLAYLSAPELGNFQTEAARAQAELAQAERSLARSKDLVEAGVIAGKDFEQAQSELMRTRAEATRTGLRLIAMGASDTVDQRYALRSPIRGVVVERNTNPGMEWRPDQPGAPLFVVSDPTYLWCWIDAHEDALPLLRPGMKVVLRSSAWPQETFEARIAHVGDALDPASRSMKVLAKLRNPERHLKGDMYVTAEVVSDARGELDVPAKAVFLSNSASQVFVKTGEGEYTRTSITPVASNDRWVSIAQGLKQGDQVVVDGALYLQKMLDAVTTQSKFSANPSAPALAVN